MSTHDTTEPEVIAPPLRERVTLDDIDETAVAVQIDGYDTIALCMAGDRLRATLYEHNGATGDVKDMGRAFLRIPPYEPRTPSEHGPATIADRVNLDELENMKRGGANFARVLIDLDSGAFLVAEPVKYACEVADCLADGTHTLESDERVCTEHREHSRPTHRAPLVVACDTEGNARWACGACGSDSLQFDESYYTWREIDHDASDPEAGRIAFAGAFEWGEGDNTPGVVCVSCLAELDSSAVELDWV